ncbi:unnamed protein product [Absidia cylindrospora]
MGAERQTRGRDLSICFNSSLICLFLVVGNGQEQLCHEEEHTVVDHYFDCLARQSKLHTLSMGDHCYNFEFVLQGNLPETTHVTNFYQVEYKLKALVERPAFIPNQSVRQVVHVSRQLFSPHSPEFMEPVYLVRRYQHDLESIISIPTKIYAYGDLIALSIVISALHPHLQMDSLTCNLKEYIILSNATTTTTVENARAHGRHLFSTKVKRFSTTTTTNDDHLTAWTKQFDVVLPSARTEMHCDMDNDRVRVRHKFKFILDFHDTRSGQVMQMRMAVPINICALPLTGSQQLQLPAYESPSHSLPSSNDEHRHQLNNNIGHLPSRNIALPTYLESLHPAPDHLPSYEEHPPPLVY